jgi:putative restriction endonuclease
VTGCTVLAVLEAAHIKPYRGERDNHSENGLLLRSDIHTLFDLDLLGIEPDRLQAELHPSLTIEYGALAGMPLGYGFGHRPSYEALRLRYGLFQRKLKQPG